MGLEKKYFQLQAPSLIGDDECAAMIAEKATNTYYIAKRKLPKKTEPFSAIIDLIEWLNIKDTGGSKAVALKDQPIYYIGKELPFLHETGMAQQNNWTLDLLKNKKVTTKEEGELEMFIYKQKPIRIDIPAAPVAANLDAFKIANIAAGPAIVPGPKLQKLYMLAAFSLAAKKAASKGRVAAILVTSGGEILSYGVKSPDNAIMHAEVTAIQSLFVNNAQRAADLSTQETYLFTTLKPCGMCAAMIKACGAGKVHVVFGQNDFGPEATGTCLDGTPGLHHKLAEDLKLKDQKQQTLLDGLNSYRTDNPGGFLVPSLDKAEPLALMNLAHERTVHKVKKYGEADTDSDKKKVMAHLESFLKSLAVISA